MNFWDNKTTPVPKPWEQPQPMVLDEEAMAVLQENPNVDIFEEDEDDTQSVMADANLRLEMGRLYQMILETDIFADTNADPKAVKNVQREIRRLVREKLEIMLGIRQEKIVQSPVVSSPFNDLEVTALKMVASKVTKGATEQAAQDPKPNPMLAAPKKDGITQISGNLRPQALSPKKETKPVQKPQSKAATKSAINQQSSLKQEEDTLLQKPIAEMTPTELLAYEQAASERRARNKSAIPANLAPHPTPQQLEMLYTSMAQNMGVKLVPPNS